MRTSELAIACLLGLLMGLWWGGAVLGLLWGTTGALIWAALRVSGLFAELPRDEHEEDTGAPAGDR